VTKAEAPIMPLEPVKTAVQDTHKQQLLHNLSLCENPSQDPFNRILDVNGRYSYGDFMFQMSTWLSYSFLGATEENIYDPILQAKIATYILDRGGWRNWWTCAQRASIPSKW
jgi:hypothetical protein